MNKELITWKAGTVIYSFGDKSDFAYFLKDGEVEIKSKNGTRVGFINKDEVFGEQSILLDTSRTVSAVALKDSSAIKIQKISLIKEFKNSSFLIQAILRATCMRLTNLAGTIEKDLESIDD